MDSETDDALEGIGKFHRVRLRDGRHEYEREMHWGLPPRGADARRLSLLRSETADIDRPCLLPVRTFGLVRRGPVLHRASLVSDQPFFCIAALWRPAYRLWPESFAALTVPAYADLAAHKDRHVAIICPADWRDWLTAARPPADMLRPFPKDSFQITPLIEPECIDASAAA